MLLNMFYGPIANAAAGIATQVQGAVMSLAGNLVTATRPQIVKLYASQEYTTLFSILVNAIKLSFILLSICTIPLLTETGYVLKLWLKTVPDNTIAFCRLTLLFNLFANMSSFIVTAIHSTGRLKRMSLINSTLYLSVLPVTWVLFKNVDLIWVPYLYNVVAVFFGMLSNAWTVHLYFKEFSFAKFVCRSLLPCILLFALVLSVSLIVTQVIEEGFLRLVINVLLSALLMIVIGFYALISSDDRKKIINLIRLKLCRVA